MPSSDSSAAGSAGALELIVVESDQRPRARPSPTNQLEAFLLEADAASAYGALLADLETTVIPNLENCPRMGRPFFDRGTGSVEAHAKIERLSLRIAGGELREYLSGDYLMLYAFTQRTVYLLSIKHQRQLSFDIERLWTEGHWGPVRIRFAPARSTVPLVANGPENQ